MEPENDGSDAAATPDHEPREAPRDREAGPRLAPDGGLHDGARLLAGGEAWLGSSSDDDHWSVPWADLMMVMFVVFALLISARGMLHRDEPDPVGVPEPEPYEVERVETREVPGTRVVDQPPLRINVLERSEEAVREAAIQKVETVLLRDQSVNVSVQGPMLFDLGRAELKPGMTDFLDRLAGIIAANPYKVRIVGHTDDHPISTAAFPTNWELSLIRASRVARYLIDAGDIDPTRFVVMGHGQYAPTVPNENEARRALNRRVEILITHEVPTGDTDEETP